METSQQVAERLGRSIDMHRLWLESDFKEIERLIAAGDFKKLMKVTQEMTLSIDALRQDVVRLENTAVKAEHTVRAEDLTLGMRTAHGTVTDYQKGLLDGAGDLYVRAFFNDESVSQSFRHESLVYLAH